MKVISNERPKLKLPQFKVDGKLAPHLDETPLLRLMNHHFSAAVMGKAGSGKTSLVQGLLATKGYMRRVFDTILVFIPPNSLHSIKNSIFSKLPSNQIYDSLTREHLESAYKRAEDNAREEKTTLIVFDDVQAYFKNKDIEPYLLHMINNRRHARLSFFIIAQSYQKIPRQIRLALTHLFAFKLSKSNLDDIYTELSEISPADWNGVLREYKRRLKADPEGRPFLFMDCSHQRYFIDWDEIEVDDDLDDHT
jgi:Cdc6-like AAA superfamily ATPase